MIGLGAAVGLGAASGLVGAGVQGAINYGLQKDQQKFNAEQAQLQRDWTSNESLLNRQFQERMSSTAYQRQMEDMKAAGINPALALGNNAASTPNGGTSSGSSASSSAASVGTPNSQVGTILDTMYTNAARETLQENEFEFKRQLRQEINSSAKQMQKTVNDIHLSKQELEMVDKNLPF